jgi:hypothetical protein
MSTSKLKFFVVGMVMAIGLLALPLASVSASGYDPFAAACGKSSEGAICSTKTSGDPLVGQNGLIPKVTRIVADFAAIIAVIIIIIGGFMYVLSGGDSGKVSLAKDTILYAAVGLVVIVLGQAIIVFVLRKL